MAGKRSATLSSLRIVASWYGHCSGLTWVAVVLAQAGPGPGWILDRQPCFAAVLVQQQRCGNFSGKAIAADELQMVAAGDALEQRKQRNGAVMHHASERDIPRHVDRAQVVAFEQGFSVIDGDTMAKVDLQFGSGCRQDHA